MNIDGLYTEQCGSGPPVLLIHGAGAFADLFGPVVGGLKPAHDVLAYDRRGHARSVDEPVTRLQVHVEDAAALIEQRLGGRACVVGWSAGANVALMLADRHPQRVGSLVLCEPSFLLRVPQLETLRALAGWETARLARGPREGALRFYRWASQFRGTGENAFDAYPEAWREQMLDNHPALFAEARLGSGAAGEALGREALSGISCPVTLLRGELTAAPFESGLRYFKRQVSAARERVVPGASHMIPTDAPEAVVSAVLAIHEPD